MYISDIHCIEERLVSMVLEQLNSDDVSCINTEELGEVIDMIKDLAETKEKLYKASYYDTIVKSMNSSDADDGRDWDSFMARTTATVHDMWNNSDTDRKTRMKTDLTALVAGMK